MRTSNPSPRLTNREGRFEPGFARIEDEIGRGTSGLQGEGGLGQGRRDGDGRSRGSREAGGVVGHGRCLHLLSLPAAIRSGRSRVGHFASDYFRNPRSFAQLLLCPAAGEHLAVGFHLLEAAVVHPADEALFNFVLGWALLFAPLIFTDWKRDRFRWSLDVFWLASMLLTNTLLIPYMAIRLNRSCDSARNSSRKPASGLQRAFTTSARIVAVTGAVVGLLSVVWFVIGRPTEGYGGLIERWDYWIDTLSKDRPTYAFIWDLCCYTVFQPWLIGDNLDNIRTESKELVAKLRFVPYVGLVAYCWGLSTRMDACKVQ